MFNDLGEEYQIHDNLQYLHQPQQILWNLLPSIIPLNFKTIHLSF